jgi:hypothetical protein
MIRLVATLLLVTASIASAQACAPVATLGGWIFMVSTAHAADRAVDDQRRLDGLIEACHGSPDRTLEEANKACMDETKFEDDLKARGYCVHRKGIIGRCATRSFPNHKERTELK